MSVEAVGVVGAGFMGSGIAEAAVRAGIEVVVFEPERAPLERSEASLRTSVDHAVGRGKLDEREAAALIERISWTTDLDALAGADVVVEAIVEDERVKADMFERLDAVASADAILTSNTSSIPIAQLAAATSRPERVVGMHFFSPVPVMKLVEILIGLDTADATVARAQSFADQIGKTAIRTKDRSGFIVNFLLVPYLMRPCGCTRTASRRARTSTRA